MTDFKPHVFGNKITLNKLGDMKIVLTKEAHEVMKVIIDENSAEVGWLGIVDRVGDNFIISEIILPAQEVNGATCELTAEGIFEATMEIMDQPDGVEKVNKIRFWGHSHVRMSTNPSAQDEKQFNELIENCDDFFIRGIGNKNGSLKFTLYLIDSGIEIDDITWELESQVDEGLIARIKRLIKEKVKPLIYIPPKTTYFPPKTSTVGQKPSGTYTNKGNKNTKVWHNNRYETLDTKYYGNGLDEYDDANSEFGLPNFDSTNDIDWEDEVKYTSEEELLKVTLVDEGAEATSDDDDKEGEE